MSKLEVFEPAMCCPTGVCGVNVDPALVQFGADLQFLQEGGYEVVRHGLTHDAGAFAANPAVVKEMEAGMDRLPIVTVDGRVVSTGIYPSRAQLMQKLGAPVAVEVAPRAKSGGCGCAPDKCC
jgi:Arsenical resistance operon protein ArsD